MKVPGWAASLVKWPIRARTRLKEALLEALRSYRKKKPGGGGPWISDILESPEFECRGFAVDINYILAKKHPDLETDCVYNHPWGSPKLLYVHKKLPICVIVGADLRLDTSVAHEAGAKIPVRGFTG